MLRQLALATAALGLLQAQNRPRLHPQPAASKDSKTGPEIGGRIPAFSLPDQMGKLQSLASLSGPKGLLLLFTRSADWCPYCKTQMLDLNRRYDEYRKQGLNIATITYDNLAILKHFGDRQNIRYPMLSDPDSKIIRAFGIFNENIEPGNRAYGVPYPGMYVLNPDGVVRSKYFEDDYTERYSAASVLTREFGVDGDGKTAIETPHLTITTSASDSAVDPGRRITLIAEMELKPGLHVYAPGVQYGYTPISWNFPVTKAAIAHPMDFPKPRTMEFSDLKEIVPVYEGRLRLVCDFTIGQEAEVGPSLTPDRKLVVDASFRYQACNDKECFAPRNIPLKWTFTIGQLDRVRVPEEIQHK